MIRAYTDLPSFAALCLTSKTIHYFCLGILYESIHLRLHKQHAESLSLLWRSIEEHRPLAGYLKYLRLQFCDPDDPYESVSEDSRGARRDQYFSQSSLIPKIMDTCSNLRTLSITYPYQVPEAVEQGINRSLANAHYLQNLELTVFDTGWPPHFPGRDADINVPLISHALSSSSLTTLSFTLQQGPESPLPALVSALPATNSITSLSLNRACLTMEALESIMRALLHLKHLSLNLDWHADPIMPHLGEWLDCKKLGKALSHRSSTLESLKIETFWWSQWDPTMGSAPGSYWGMRDSIGDLRSFKRLTSLELAPEVLLAWEGDVAPPLSKLLPDSLRHLILRWDFGDWEYSPWEFERLCGFVNDYLSSLPRPQLESLVLTCYGDENVSAEEGQPPPFTSVEAICDENHIKCRLDITDVW